MAVRENTGSQRPITDILTFWKTYSNKSWGIVLAPLARAILAIPPSSSEPERAFSNADMLCVISETVELMSGRLC